MNLYPKLFSHSEINDAETEEKPNRPKPPGAPPRTPIESPPSKPDKKRAPIEEPEQKPEVDKIKL